MNFTPICSATIQILFLTGCSSQQRTLAEPNAASTIVERNHSVRNAYMQSIELRELGKEDDAVLVVYNALTSAYQDEVPIYLEDIIFLLNQPTKEIRGAWEGKQILITEYQMKHRDGVVIFHMIDDASTGKYLLDTIGWQPYAED